MVNQNETLWSIAEGKMDNGNPYILRFREFYATEQEMQNYSSLVEIIWIYEDSGSGMPDRKTYEKMNHFEDVLEDKIESQEICLLTTSITGNQKRIWQIYAANSDLFMQELNKAMENQEVLPLQIEIFRDEEWNGYKEIVGLVQ